MANLPNGYSNAADANRFSNPAAGNTGGNGTPTTSADAQAIKAQTGLQIPGYNYGTVNTGSPQIPANTTNPTNTMAGYNAGTSGSQNPPTVPAQPVYTGDSAAAAVSNATSKFNSVNSQIASYNANKSTTPAKTSTYTFPDGRVMTYDSNGSFISMQPAPVAPSTSTSTTPSTSTSTSTSTPATPPTTQTTQSQTTPPPTPPDLSNVQVSVQDQQQITSLQNMMATMDTASQNLISALTQQYDNRIQAQNIQNQLSLSGVTTQNIASGIDRYAPTVANSIFTAQEAANNRTLNELESTKYQSLVQAQQAQAQQDFSMLDKIHTDYVDAENRQRDILQKQYDNSMTYQTNQREQRAADLDYATKTAENFAPGILKDMQSITDPAQRDAYIANFAQVHNIDPGTLTGVVQKYQDTQNQTMRTAMYTMLADNPRAGITMDDINGYNIGAVAQKVANGPDFALKTDAQKAQLASAWAQASLAQAQVSMLKDPSGLIAATDDYINTGKLPSNELMAMAVQKAAPDRAAQTLPAGTIVSPNGIKAQNVPADVQTAVATGQQLIGKVSEIKALLEKVHTGPLTGSVIKLGNLTGLPSTDYEKLNQDIAFIQQNYEKSLGGVRAASSQSLLDTLGAYFPNVNKNNKYNLADIDNFNDIIINNMKDNLSSSGLGVLGVPLLTTAEKTQKINDFTSQMKAQGYSAAEIQSTLQQNGLE